MNTPDDQRITTADRRPAWGDLRTIGDERGDTKRPVTLWLYGCVLAFCTMVGMVLPYIVLFLLLYLSVGGNAGPEEWLIGKPHPEISGTIFGKIGGAIGFVVGMILCVRIAIDDRRARRQPPH